MTTTLPPDPLESPLWQTMVENYLPGRPVVFDPAVQVGLPPVTEDQTQVPIMIDARKLGRIDELVVIADLSPFPLTLKLKSSAAPAMVGFRTRIEQGTVIRAAALKDGQWHVGARYLDAAGGGCSAPPSVEARLNWDDIGRMRAQVWREAQNEMRLRLRIIHPMDTGLHKEPAFFIQKVALTDAAGAALGEIEVHESIASNPMFTLALAAPKQGDHIVVKAQDNDGGTFVAKVPMAPATNVIREGRL